MVPFEKLYPCDQAILLWRMENPELFGFIMGVIMTLTVVCLVLSYHIEKKRQAEELQREREYRAARRAWIKSHGGL